MSEPERNWDAYELRSVAETLESEYGKDGEVEACRVLRSIADRIEAFTREDVKELRFIASSDGWDRIRLFASSLADRIEALLPQEGP